MTQLVPFYFVNEITFTFAIIVLTIYILSKYILPRFVRIFLSRNFILQLTKFYPRKVWVNEYSYLKDLLFKNFRHYRTKIIPKIGEPLKIIEYPLILLFVISGAVFLISTSDLVSLFLSLELQSYDLYLLSTIYRNSDLSTTGDLIYFLLGGLSSCFILDKKSLNSFLFFIRKYILKYIYNYINKYINSYYLNYRNLLLNYIITNYSYLIDNFILNLKKGNLNFAIKELYLDLKYIIMPSMFKYLSLVFLSLSFHSGTFFNGELFNLNSDIQILICYLLDVYLVFIIPLYVSGIVIKYKAKFNTLIYNFIIIILSVCLIILAGLFCYILNILCLKIISLIINIIWDYIVKMMANPGSAPSGPGGFGEPIGGGGRDPKKPGGSDPIKGHYQDKKDKPKRRRANYLKMTPEEALEYKRNIRADKNKRRREAFASKSEEEKIEFRAHEREIKARVKDSLPLDEVELRQEIYNETRRERYEEDKEFINARKRELFSLKDEEEKEFIRENDRERYRNSGYDIQERKRINKREQRAKKKED